MTKNESIKESLHATTLKRKNQYCKTYTVKIQENKLSHLKKEKLERIFLEAK